MWTPTELASEAGPLSGRSQTNVWRVVRDLDRVPLIQIAEDFDDLAYLEAAIDRSRMIVPRSCDGLHPLLAEPFRYVPDDQGSRFRRPGRRGGVFYGAARENTAVAEACFRHWCFVADAPTMTRPSGPARHCAFVVPCQSDHAIFLMEKPLSRDRAIWQDASDYRGCWNLADAAREGGIEVIVYESVRDPNNGSGVAILSPAVFRSLNAAIKRMWFIFLRSDCIQAWAEYPKRQELEFRRSDFANDPRLD